MDEKNNVLETSGAIKDVKVQIIAELGRTVLNLGEVSALGKGTILELDKFAGEPIDLYANNVKIAVGETVLIDEKFGIRITDIVKAD
ncbi:MAG: FliM/FliN family flagellar motor switch protein [Treponema sp.]|nr:FliM/FliN family flagellar motor switch protein [Treponema sp.]